MKLSTTLAALFAATVVAAPELVKPRALYNDAAPHPNDANFISAVMRAHWYWRRLHCAQDLVWDQGLAEAARRDIAECTNMPEHASHTHPLTSPANPPRCAPAATCPRRSPPPTATTPGSSSPAPPPTAGTRRRPSTRTTAPPTTTPGATSRRWCGATRRASAAPWATATRTRCSGPAASTAFAAQVWGPVCGDPSTGDVRKRAEVGYDWTRK
ncbi:hypothetical protein OPT61_g10249 [Boeremia exigua]|uniref:Uncharacterized protein n=1 Tax=Boeremia exigua TaxID=749465 RepID=A0ACC2HQJ1_9PLEO|nr:hypothetical protein OPT61_g10249 [Boeremia exigua]